MTVSRNITKEELSKIRSKARKEFYANGGKHPKGMLGKNAWNKGKLMKEETRKKISLSKIGKKLTSIHKKHISDSNKGKHRSEETKIKISKANSGKKRPSCSGENHYLWIKDRTIAIDRHRLRSSIEWKLWRIKIYERDIYTCQECNKKGVYLEAHHIIPVRVDINKIFDINNGITLCLPCHKKTLKKESKFELKYSNIVSSKNG